MLRDPVTALVEDTVAAHPEVSAVCLTQLLRGRQLYLPPSPPTRWKTGDARAVLLDLAPARVTDTDDLATHAGPALVALLDLLERTGRLHPGSAKPATVRREVTQAAALLPAALADRSRWGLAKTLYTQMHTEGLDLDDDDVVEAWAEAFSQRDDAARIAVLAHLDRDNRLIANEGAAAA